MHLISSKSGGLSTIKWGKYHVTYLAEVYVHSKGIGWKKKNGIEANSFLGTKDTRAELLWKVTTVHCYSELCWMGDKT